MEQQFKPVHEITIDKFIDDILRLDRRYFSYTEFKGNFDLGAHPRIEELKEYLASQDLKNSPLIINYSILTGINASGLVLQYLRSSHTDFTDANFYGANLSHGSFVESSFNKANLTDANFSDTLCSAADFREATIAGADFTNSHVSPSILLSKDWKDAKLDAIVKDTAVKNVLDALSPSLL